MGFLNQPITLQSIFGQKREIGPIEVQLIISEETTDTLTITKQPVQTGASITDHAYQEPTILSMVIQQQNTDLIGGLLSTFSGGGGLSAIYQTFLDLQSSRQPFSVVTPKRIYKNMLVSVIGVTTDKTTENVLSLRLSMQQVLLVGIGTAIVPAINQASAALTQATQNLGKQSAISSFAQGVKGLVR
jgi:hypothetical protein